MFETKWGNNQYVFGKRIAGLITLHALAIYGWEFNKVLYWKFFLL